MPSQCIQIAPKTATRGTNTESCVVQVVYHNGTVIENVQSHCRYTICVNSCSGVMLLLICMIILAIVLVVLAKAFGLI